MWWPFKNNYGSAGYDSTGENQIRTGKVVNRRVTNVGAQVKVKYTDRDGTESDWLPVGQMGSKGTIFYQPPPDIGTQVTVAHFPTGIERGVVLCTNNTIDNPSFTPRSIDAFGIQFKDGSYFEYDPQAGCFSINGFKTAYINASGQVQLIAGGDVDVTSKTQINANGVIIDASGNVTIPGTLTVQGETNLNAGGTATPHLANADGSGAGA